MEVDFFSWIAGLIIRTIWLMVFHAILIIRSLIGGA